MGVTADCAEALPPIFLESLRKPVARAFGTLKIIG
jgi:hypothetical protein